MIYHTYVIRSQLWYNNQSKWRPFLIYHTIYMLASSIPRAVSACISIKTQPTATPQMAYRVCAWGTCTLLKSLANLPQIPNRKYKTRHNPLQIHSVINDIIHHHAYYTEVSTITSLSASPRSAFAMNAGMSCHCCANVLNKCWHTEAWCNAYAFRPSKNNVSWGGKVVGKWLALSGLRRMWSAHLFHQSLSHSRNTNTQCISSRSSTSSVYCIACTHHSTLRAVAFTQCSCKRDKQDSGGMYLHFLPDLHLRPSHLCS